MADPNSIGHSSAELSIAQNNAGETSPSPVKPSGEQLTRSITRLRGWRLLVVNTLLCLGLLLSVKESSIVATALVTIGLDFNDFETATWIVLGYLLSYMAFAIVIARLSDVIGRRWALLSSWMLFTTFSLASGLAKSIDQLIAFRTLQGVGGSGLYTLTMVIAPEVSPPKTFAIMSACSGVVFAIAGVLGPIIGGVITRNSSWRWVFLLNPPFGLVAIVGLLISWPSSVQSLVVNKVSITGVDWPGALLLLCASILFVFGLQEGGASAFAWNSPTIIVTLTLSVFCWTAFGVWITIMHYRQSQGKSQKEAILPLSILLRGKQAVVLLTTALTGFVFILVLIFLPQRFQIVQLSDPVQAGIRLSPMLCSIAVGSAMSALGNLKRNVTFPTLVFGSGLIVLGCGLLSTAEKSWKVPAREYGYQVIFGLGVGAVFATATIMCGLEARFKDLAVAQGTLNQARVFGGAMSLSIATIVFNSRARADLSNALTKEELVKLQKAPDSAYSLSFVKQMAVRDVFAYSFNEQLRVCTYVAAVSFVISLFAYARNPPNILDRKTQHEAILAGELLDD